MKDIFATLVVFILATAYISYFLFSLYRSLKRYFFVREPDLRSENLIADSCSFWFAGIPLFILTFTSAASWLALLPILLLENAMDSIELPLFAKGMLDFASSDLESIRCNLESVIFYGKNHFKSAMSTLAAIAFCIGVIFLQGIKKSLLKVMFWRTCWILLCLSGISVFSNSVFNSSFNVIGFFQEGVWDTIYLAIALLIFVLVKFGNFISWAVESISTFSA